MAVVLNAGARTQCAGLTYRANSFYEINKLIKGGGEEMMICWHHFGTNGVIKSIFVESNTLRPYNGNEKYTEFDSKTVARGRKLKSTYFRKFGNLNNEKIFFVKDWKFEEGNF